MGTINRVAPLYRSRSVPILPTGDESIDRAVESVRKLVDDAETSQIGKGRVIAGVVLQPAANTTVSHKLGRTPVGWTIVDATGSAPRAYRIAWDDKTITLAHSGAANATVALWVF